MTGRTIGLVRLGRRPYGETLELQRALCRARIDGALPHDVLLLVEHPLVVTLGRSTKASSLPITPAGLVAKGAEVFEIERGGDVTLHAPGQLVGYPILHLEEHRTDLHWYLRQLEEILIGALATLDVSGIRNPGLTGVWTDGRKIASIGVHVKRWVTLHGFALNVTTDLSLFDLIVPCGIPDVTMTSIARELANAGRSPDTHALWRDTVDAVAEAFAAGFHRTATLMGPEELAAVAAGR